MADLLATDELPEGFEYPPLFLRIIELGLIDFEPWYILAGQSLRDHVETVRQRLPDPTLVVFARRQDCDDIACFIAGDQRVVVVDPFETPSDRRLYELPNFNAWLREAVEELIKFEEPPD